MIKIAANSVTICALFLCSGMMAMAGSPYNPTIPAPGSGFRPHVTQPSLKQNPVISRSLGHTQRSVVQIHQYIAITKNRARKQGVVKAGGVRWNCKGNRCMTHAAWTRPTVQVCRALARMVGVIQSYGMRGVSLKAKGVKRCNTGVAIARKNSQLASRRIVVRAPVLAPPRAVNVISKPLQPSPSIGKPTLVRQGGFIPPKQPLHRGQTGNGSAETEEDIVEDNSLPLEKKVMNVLNKLMRKKEAGVDSTTREVSKLAGTSTGTKFQPAHRGGFAPPPKGGFASAGISVHQPISPPNERTSGSFSRRIRTAELSAVGTGESVIPGVFTPYNVRTGVLSVTGTGESVIPGVFTPHNIRTGVLSVTGTGRI